MDAVAIWIVVYLLSGAPFAFTAIVPPDHVCGEELALSIARAKQAEIGPIQDEVLWMCKTVPHRDPAEPIEQPDIPLTLKRNS